MRILIARLSSIGDVLTATPIARALRERFPEGYLAWVAEEPSRQLLEHNPYLDEVLPWPGLQRWRRLARAGQGLQALREWRDATRELRARRFDVALELHGLMKSALVCWLSGAPRRIGPTTGREGSRLLMTEGTVWNRNITRTTAGYLGMLKPLGVEHDDFDMTLVLTAQERAFARSFLADQGVSDQDPVAAFCAATTRPQKHWIEGYWSSLADALWETFGMRSLVLGGPGDTGLAQRIQARAQAPVLSAAGRTSLREAAALIERAQLCIGVDTGLMHAGIAVRTPTIALFGSTPSQRLTDEPNVLALNRHLSCAPCYRRPTCAGRFDCMREIRVADVMRAAARLLEGRT